MSPNPDAGASAHEPGVHRSAVDLVRRTNGGLALPCTPDLSTGVLRRLSDLGEGLLDVRRQEREGGGDVVRSRRGGHPAGSLGPRRLRSPQTGDDDLSGVGSAIAELERAYVDRRHLLLQVVDERRR